MDSSQPSSSVHGILWARILEWVAIPFSRVSSWPRDQTQVSCIAGRFFTIWATRKALKSTPIAVPHKWVATENLLGRNLVKDHAPILCFLHFFSIKEAVIVINWTNPCGFKHFSWEATKSHPHLSTITITCLYRYLLKAQVATDTEI